MEKQGIPVAISELEDVQKTMLALLNTFPELPEQVQKDGIFFEQLKPNSVSMCMSTLPNAIIKEKYIGGSYLAKYPFKLVLQSMSVTNEQRIDSQAILSKIGEWLELRTMIDSHENRYELGEYPEMLGDRNITKIYRTGGAKLMQRIPPNIEISEARFETLYYVKGDGFLWGDPQNPGTR